MLSTFASLADFIGIFAFALAGIMSAQHRRVDPVGVFVLAFTTAFGGGIFRDVIIDNRPYYWIENEAYVWMTIALAALAPAVISRFKRWFAKSVFIWLDAVGLGFFSVSGTALCLEAGLPPLSSSILGVCTGAMGGMLRDVFLNRMPLVLSDRQPYALAAFAGCWLFIALDSLWPATGTPGHEAALWVSAAAIIGVRMFCWYNKLNIIYYGVFHKIFQKASKLRGSSFRASVDRRTPARNTDKSADKNANMSTSKSPRRTKRPGNTAGNGRDAP